VVPRPAEERKKQAGKRTAATQIPFAGEEVGRAAELGAVGKYLSDQCKDDEDAWVSVSGARKGSLELGRGLVAAEDAQHGKAAEFDRDDRKQEDAGKGTVYWESFPSGFSDGVKRVAVVRLSFERERAAIIGSPFR
jgi:hypothetical protein